MYKRLASIVCIAALAACSQKPAQIVMHNQPTPQERPVFAPQGDVPFTPVFGNVKQKQPAPVHEITIKDLTPPEKGSRGNAKETAPKQKMADIHEEQGVLPLREGDTLMSVARRNGIPAKDLVTANNLTAPYDLSGMTSLKLPTPETGVKIAAATTVIEVRTEATATETAAIVMPAVIAPTPAPGAPQPRFRPEATMVSAVIEENDGFKPFSVKPKLASKNRFIWPVAGKVISRFGAKSGGLYNDGVNIAAPEGAPVYASMDGQVVYAGNDLPSYGNLLILRHKNGWLTAYAHTQKIVVQKGQKVKLGQKIASVGKTGNVQTPQVHFGIREGRKPLDPVLKVKG